MIRRDYKSLVENMRYSSTVKLVVENLIKSYKLNKHRYKYVSDVVKIPSEVIFVIHYLESNCNFRTHLHNGDPLTGRTVHVPKGRPVSGSPPFKWEDSAIDALLNSGLNIPSTWDINNTLNFLESYNGWGYLRRGIQSPYIFGNTNLHEKGKFRFDGKFDPEAKTKQIGAAVILKEMGFFDLNKGKEV